jgi:hypothetical protein
MPIRESVTHYQSLNAMPLLLHYKTVTGKTIPRKGAQTVREFEHSHRIARGMRPAEKSAVSGAGDSRPGTFFSDLRRLRAR